jgi:hypothetical protein
MRPLRRHPINFVDQAALACLFFGLCVLYLVVIYYLSLFVTALAKSSANPLDHGRRSCLPSLALTKSTHETNIIRMHRWTQATDPTCLSGTRERRVDTRRASLTRRALGHCIIDSFPAGLAKKTLPPVSVYQLSFLLPSSSPITYSNI